MVRESQITTGIISNKSTQILVHGDDIDIIGRTEKTAKETFRALERAAKRMRLAINTNKIKYMRVLQPALNRPLQMDGRVIEAVDEFGIDT